MPCVCTHDKLVHETWRDYGWHEGGCTKCECECFYAKRTYEKDLRNGFKITRQTQILYNKNFSNSKGTECRDEIQ